MMDEKETVEKETVAQATFLKRQYEGKFPSTEEDDYERIRSVSEYLYRTAIEENHNDKTLYF